MKSKFLSALAVLAVAACVAAADDKPKFFLEDGKVVERFAAVETDVSKLKSEVAELRKAVADLKAGNVIAVGEGGELGADPVTIPLKPVKAAAPCVCGSGCTCAEGACPGGCPTQPIQFRQVCENGVCRQVPVAAPTACYALGQCPSCPAAPQAAPCASCQPSAFTPASAAAFTGRRAFLPRLHHAFENRPRLFGGRLFGGGCCGG